MNSSTDSPGATGLEHQAATAVGPAGSKENKVNTENMSTAELRGHIERCQRLVERSQLLERLPDRGEGIRHRLDTFSRELQRRESVDATAVPPPTEDQPTAKVSDRAAQPTAESAEVYASNVAAIMEKYKDYRVPVEDTVRKMYGSSLSEREIARILEDVPETYFLTYSESVAREREMAKQARLEELAKLRQQSATRR